MRYPQLAWAGRAIKTLGWTLLPGRCLLCLLPSERPRDLCIYCERDLGWLTGNGANDDLFAVNIASHKTHTISETDTRNISATGNRNFASIVTPLAYQGCAAWLVQQQKQRKASVAARMLAELLADAVLRSATQPLPEALVPVPLYWARHFRRGHNQSTVLARVLSHRLGVPVLEHLARRVRHTPSQQSLSRTDRAENLHGAFRARPLGKTTRIAIIDDVVTTGATSAALAQALVAAGATEVHLWAPTRAILRTP